MAGAVFAVLGAAEDEGLTVSALAHCGVLLVCAYTDLFKSAVALAGVVSALLNGAGDAMIILLFHFKYQTFRKKLI